ncbi:hypothetical protein [Anaerococcus rubeinfantis]|uniref:hypothetical protein n=1 Tax=Anaerococcus rubeinfantis TaxID=1720199 RepID=UPI00073F1B7A|nr:hypothetical protein [Anaerococcus rubeinfantis]
MIIIMYIFILFSAVFEYNIPYINYWDEIIFIISILYLTSIVLKKGEIKRITFNILLLSFLVIVIGIIGNFNNSTYQTNKIAMLKDVVAYLKFPITFIALPKILKIMNIKRKFKEITIITKIITIIMFISMILGYFIDIGLYKSEEDRILKTFLFIFPHPTFLVFTCLIMLIIFMIGEVKLNKTYLFMCLSIMFMTQRSKAYFIVAFILAILLIPKRYLENLFTFRNNRMLLKKRYIFLSIILVSSFMYLFAKDKFILYFQYGLTAARPALYLVGLRLAYEHFPLGTGFGTFASSLSGRYYSSIYYNYGISNVLGISEDNISYIGDVYWPYIYGQFGILGFLLQIRIFIKLFFYYFKKIVNNINRKSYIIIWAYSIFASFAEAFFTNSTSVQMSFIISLCLLVNNE